ncbi:hypothetical protein BP6252_04821 [Coleophoma cylindrospora]|uniref:DNA recombination and repair protein Rad51-like C-terminal domain-containing protein n=1 Tax=Coleophoma cylindrospora TaxID=1849047 RepID=A0A3D8S1J5_9HELO|nr:hypothetical protein BP6252_04821 [Coleophoma cylindrospora]
MPQILNSQPDAEPAPEPATAITADKLLELERAQRRRFLKRGDGEELKARTGLKELDDYVLGGGVDRGVVLGISAGSGSGGSAGEDGTVEGRLISLHLLMSILITSVSSRSQITKPVATIIDTTGSFPIQLLVQILSSCLGKDREEDVSKLLELVTISRVFDLEGLWEVLSELSQKPSSVPPGSENQPETKVETGSLEIGDSEDEEDDDVGENFLKVKEEVVDEGVEVIIIDNMTHIINELFSRKEKSSAHNLLTILNTHLRMLTRTNNVLTILHNTTVSPSTKATSTTHQQELQSVFSTTTQKPSLGLIFAQFPDLHLLISPQPRERSDIEMLYCSDDENDVDGQKTRKPVHYCFILEVLRDECPFLDQRRKSRFGEREERWLAFGREKEGGVGLVSIFRAKEDSMGINMAQEGVVSDVGTIAKMHGFGGRRV